MSLGECNQVKGLVGRIFSGPKVTEMDLSSVIFASKAERIKFFKKCQQCSVLFECNDTFLHQVTQVIAKQSAVSLSFDLCLFGQSHVHC